MSLFLQAATEIPYGLGASIGGALVVALGTVFKLWLAERAETKRRSDDCEAQRKESTAAILAEREKALAAQAPLVKVVGEMAASLTELATLRREDGAILREVRTELAEVRKERRASSTTTPAVRP